MLGVLKRAGQTGGIELKLVLLLINAMILYLIFHFSLFLSVKCTGYIR